MHHAAIDRLEQVYKIDTLRPVDYAVDDDGDEVTVRLSIRGHGKVGAGAAVRRAGGSLGGARAVALG